MNRRYYSSRNNPHQMSLEELYLKFQNFYILFRDKEYFSEIMGISKVKLPNAVKHEAIIHLSFQPFPITRWDESEITEDRIFDTLEFLYDRVSKPGEYGWKTDETGFNYQDYLNYDQNAGQEEFREIVNGFLGNYKTGYELSKDGTVLALGSHGLQFILDTDIIPFDKENVDDKVRNAISKWRNRRLSLIEQKEAIREMADVFEWLKKTEKITKVLNNKDDSLIFELANKFAIRHHNPEQISNYDQSIWFSWIFHFYLATYHATIRLLLKKGNEISTGEK
jgi:hypothetical protein